MKYALSIREENGQFFADCREIPALSRYSFSSVEEVNNSRLKSKALLSQPKPLDNIRACLHQPLGYQLIAQTLQILTCIDVTVRTVTTVLANKSVLLPATNGTAM